MKVLFLDIDGVCNSASYMRSLAKGALWLDIDPKQAALVQQIVRETGCKIVLSSTWRLYPEARQTVRDTIGDFIDCTVDMQRGGKWGIVERGKEVREWMRRHPEVRRYAILDDNSDFYKYQPLFLTTWEVGLTPEIAQKVIDHLNA